MRMDIQAINKQRRMLLVVSIPTVFEHIVDKLTDCVEVFGAFVWIGSFCGHANGELVKKQYDEHEQMCKLLCYVLTSCILLRCCAVGVKTNQCSLDCIIEEIDVHNNAHVLHGLIVIRMGGSLRSPYNKKYKGRFTNRPYNDNGNHTSGQPHGIARTGMTP